MDEGDKKRDAQDLRGALKNYEAADAIMKVPTTGLEVAKTQIALNMFLEARDTLGRVLRLPPKPNEPAPFTAARKAADQLNNDLATRIPSIQVTLTNAGPNDAPQVAIDNDTIPRAALAVPRKVNPGPHTVTVKLGTAEKKQEVAIAEHETKNVTIDLKEIVAEPPPPAPPPEPTHSALPKVLMFGGFGLGAVGVGVGAVTGLMSISQTNDLKDVCKPTCPPERQSDIDSAKGLGNISTVAFIVGGVGVAAGVVGLILSSGDKKESASWQQPKTTRDRRSIHAVVTPGYAGVAGSF